MKTRDNRAAPNLLEPKSVRVLCAEDDASLASMLKAALERAGYSVECVDDGQKALTRIAADPAFFHVLVTDHHMPQLSGLGLVSKLRDTAFAGTIIVYSSALTPSERSAFEALAVDVILSKPVQLPSLIEAIRHASPARI